MISAFTDQNVKDPVASYDQSTKRLAFASLRSQLGTVKPPEFGLPALLQGRAVLQLRQRPSWIPNSSIGDYDFLPVLMANTAPIEVIHTPWSFIVNAAEMETVAGVPAVGDAYFLVKPSYTSCWSAPLSSDHSAFEGQALADLSHEKLDFNRPCICGLGAGDSVEWRRHCTRIAVFADGHGRVHASTLSNRPDCKRALAKSR